MTDRRIVWPDSKSIWTDERRWCTCLGIEFP